MDEITQNHLRAWRKFRRLSQEELAEAIGSSKAVIGHLETGRSGLSHKWLIKLADALQTTPGFLLDHDPNKLDTAFLEAAMAVPASNREQALAILKTFGRTGFNG
jgi:transcriptional regulator with XRE-family HTH domain